MYFKTDSKVRSLQALRYIHNNPVKAKMVSDVSAYEWSSYNSYTDRNNMLVDATEKQIIFGLFQGSIEQFEAFHLKEDDCEFLEIEEDLEKEREEKAQNIINKYRQQNRIGGNWGIEFRQGNLGKSHFRVDKKESFKKGSFITSENSRTSRCKQGCCPQNSEESIVH